MVIYKHKLEQKNLKESSQKFTRYLAVKIYEDREYMLSYSQISGILYVPNHEPTFFESLKLLKKAITKTREYMKKTNPEAEQKTKYIIYKVDFTSLP